MGEAAAELWNHKRFTRIYPEYIYQSHSIIRASVPLMQAAELACSEPEHAHNPVLYGFSAYLGKHIPEESGHHKWILDDGEALGLSRTSILERLPTQSAAELVGVQYYWIHHYNPISLAGYIATMEGSPDPIEFIQEIAGRNGLPLKCFSSLLYHAKIDHRHRHDFDEVMDALPLTPRDHELIGLSILKTTQTMTRILRQIIKTGLSA